MPDKSDTNLGWVESLVAYVNANLSEWLIRAGTALAILIGGWILSKIIGGLVKRLVTRTSKNEMLAGFAGSIVKNGVVALAVITALGRLGVDTTSFAAILAAAGLAIGLAFQGSLGNLASGVLIVIFQPFNKGDYVKVADIEGTVEEVSMFATTLLTPNSNRVIVGNSDVTSNPITNFSTDAERRVDVVVGIGYSEDIDSARSALMAKLPTIEGVLAEPSPGVFVSELADSSVNLIVRTYCESDKYWDVFFGVQEVVKKTLDAKGIEIPFPQRDVHLIQAAE